MTMTILMCAQKLTDATNPKTSGRSNLTSGCIATAHRSIQSYLPGGVHSIEYMVPLAHASLSPQMASPLV